MYPLPPRCPKILGGQTQRGAGVGVHYGRKRGKGRIHGKCSKRGQVGSRGQGVNGGKSGTRLTMGDRSGGSEGESMNEGTVSTASNGWKGGGGCGNLSVHRKVFKTASDVAEAKAFFVVAAAASVGVLALGGPRTTVPRQLVLGHAAAAARTPGILSGRQAPYVGLPLYSVRLGKGHEGCAWGCVPKGGPQPTPHRAAAVFQRGPITDSRCSRHRPIGFRPR